MAAKNTVLMLYQRGPVSAMHACILLEAPMLPVMSQVMNVTAHCLSCTLCALGTKSLEHVTMWGTCTAAPEYALRQVLVRTYMMFSAVDFNFRLNGSNAGTN